MIPIITHKYKKMTVLVIYLKIEKSVVAFYLLKTFERCKYTLFFELLKFVLEKNIRSNLWQKHR